MRTRLLAAALALAPAVALAGGYAVPNIAPRDLAMAGSAHAAQVDAGATFVNPAALARLDGLSISLGVGMIDNRATWTDPTGTQTPSTASQYVRPAWPPEGFVAYGMPLSGDMRLGFGAGTTVPFGGNVYWPADWPGRFEIINVDRRIFGTYLNAGLQLAKWVRVGGGFIWYRGTEKLEQRVNFIDTETTASLAAAGNSFSYQASAEVQPIEPLTIAIDYKHKSDMRLTGNATFGGAPPQFTSRTLDQGVSHDLTMPNYFAIGAAWRFSPQALVTAAFTWDRFKVYDKDAFIGSAGTSIIVPRNYNNGYTFRLGTELVPMEKLKVRLGVLRDIAPTPPEWLNATIPDSDVWAGSIGLGYTVLPGLDVNVAYFHAWYDTVTTPAVSPGPPPVYNVFPGTYEPFANIASIGISWAPEQTFGKM